MKYTVYNQQGEKIKDAELLSAVFEVPLNKDLLHQVIVAQDANSRVAIAHTKQRSDVKGGGRKPWRQKGTGRARHGSIRSPLWKGGGVTFGPLSIRNFSKKVNKKMKRKALYMTLSDKVAGKQLILLDALTVAEGKTKNFVTTMNVLFNKIVTDVENKSTSTGFSHSTLIVVPDSNSELIRSSSNIPKVKVIRADSLNVKDVVKYDWLVMTEPSLEIIEKTYVK